jgi:uncharacterized membrane protein
MRTTKDRIRHAVLFEIIGMALAIPLGTWVFAKPIQAIGVVAVAGATIATLWNYIYNLGFDHAMLRLRGGVRKTLPIRVLHAVLFELGLLLVLLPFIAWYLELSVLYALQMDIAFAVFYVVYAFLFNWGYDLVFPIAPIATEPANSGEV